MTGSLRGLEASAEKGGTGLAFDSSEPLTGWVWLWLLPAHGTGPCEDPSCFPAAGLRKPDAHSRAAEENPAEGFPRHLGWETGVPE